VPQGSILGPILFLIYVNGLFNLNLIGTIQLYADDAVLSYSEKTFDNLYVSISSDLAILKKWFTTNRLTMNIDKTKFVVFETKNTNTAENFDEVSVGSEKISRVDEYKYLGLWIDSKLNFASHIIKTRKSIAPIIGVIKRIRPYVIADVLNNLYFAYIHSRLSYMVGIWGMAAQDKLKILQVLQNKSLKNIRQLPFRYPTRQLYSKQILPLEKLRELEMILTVHKILKGKFKYGTPIVYRHQIHGYSTRNSQNIQLPQFRLNLSRNSFNYEAFNRFNEIPQEIRETNNYIFFKNFVKTKLYNEYITTTQ
jgi:hypothetical protein